MNNKLKTAFIVLGAFFIGGFAMLVIFFVEDGRKKDTANEDKYMATVVVDGYEMDIPNKYSATILEDMGLMYWDEDNFDILISVETDDYTTLISTLSGSGDMLDEAEDMRVIIPYTELAVDGRSYLYMLYESSGDLVLHMYSGAEKNQVFEMIVFCYEIENIMPQTEAQIKSECEKMILVVDSILSTARITDKENTPGGQLYMGDDVYEELRQDITIDISEKYLKEDSLTDADGNVLVTYKVADEFSFGGEYQGITSPNIKLYRNYDSNVFVKTYVETELDKENTVTARDYINQGATTWGGIGTAVESVMVGNYEFWYYIYNESYNYEGENVVENHMIAAAELKNGQLYCINIKADSMDVDLKKISEEFMIIN